MSSKSRHKKIITIPLYYTPNDTEYDTFLTAAMSEDSDINKKNGMEFFYSSLHYASIYQEFEAK